MEYPNIQVEYQIVENLQQNMATEHQSTVLGASLTWL